MAPHIAVWVVNRSIRGCLATSSTDLHMIKEAGPTDSWIFDTTLQVQQLFVGLIIVARSEFVCYPQISISSPTLVRKIQSLFLPFITLNILQNIPWGATRMESLTKALLALRLYVNFHKKICSRVLGPQKDSNICHLTPHEFNNMCDTALKVEPGLLPEVRLWRDIVNRIGFQLKFTKLAYTEGCSAFALAIEAPAERQMLKECWDFVSCEEERWKTMNQPRLLLTDHFGDSDIISQEYIIQVKPKESVCESARETGKTGDNADESADSARETGKTGDNADESADSARETGKTGDNADESADSARETGKTGDNADESTGDTISSILTDGTGSSNRSKANGPSRLLKTGNQPRVDDPGSMVRTCVWKTSTPRAAWYNTEKHLRTVQGPPNKGTASNPPATATRPALDDAAPNETHTPSFKKHVAESKQSSAFSLSSPNARNTREPLIESGGDSLVSVQNEPAPTTPERTTPSSSESHDAAIPQKLSFGEYLKAQYGVDASAPLQFDMQRTLDKIEQIYQNSLASNEYSN